MSGGRLAQGNDNGIKGTNTIQFIFHYEVPKGKKVTHASYIYNYRPLKEEPFCIRITVGSDKLDYTEDARSPATNLFETKILINSIILDAKHGACFMYAIIKDHFLVTSINDSELCK